MMGWYGGAIGPLGLLATGVIWLFLIGLTVWMLAWLLPGGSNEKTSMTDESPVEILNRQLTDGQIDLAAWQSQRTALMAPVAGSTDRPRDLS